MQVERNNFAGRVPNGGPTPPGSGIFAVKGPMTNKIDEAAYSLDNCIGPESSDIFHYLNLKKVGMKI